MQQKKRSLGFMLAILCTFTLLLAACRTDQSSNSRTTSQNTTRLNLQATPSPTVIKPATYVGHVTSENAWVGISTDGKRMITFVTDGSRDHKPTFAQWFESDVKNGSVDTTATAKNGSDHLRATLTDRTASGTINFANGKSLAFTANPVPASDKTAGLYRGEQTVNNQRYTAGWVVLPTTSASEAEGPSVPEEASTPSTEDNATPMTTEGTPSAADTATPSATGTTTPSATGTTTPSAEKLQQGGAVVNDQNHAVEQAPILTQEQINSKQVAVPNLATFKLTQCRDNLCS